MKKLILLLMFAGTMSNAAVDGGFSYFTVSTHEPAAGKPVEVMIHLRDGENRPADAARVELAGTSAPVTMVKPGEYRGQVILAKAGDKLDLQVRADGVTVLENLFGGSGAYTRNPQKSAMEQIGGAYRIISFSDELDSYWHIGAVSGDSLLRDRVYIVSARAGYEDVRGKGVAVNSGQRNAGGKFIRTEYSPFRTGNGENVVLEKRVRILKDAVSASFSAVALRTRGVIRFDQMRLRVSPTLAAHENEGRKIVSSPPARTVKPASNYIAVPQEKIQAIQNELQKNSEKYGQAPFAAVADKLRQIAAGMPKTVNAATAMQYLNDLEKLEPEIKAATGLAERKAISSALESADIYGPHIRAMAAVKSGDTLRFQQGFKLPVTGENSSHGAEAGAAYDRDNLHITARFADLGSKVDAAAAKDDPGIWRGDTVEVFVGDPKSRSYKQFVLGAGGQMFDSQDGDAFVNFGWHGKTTLGDGSWTAEFTLPWSALGIDPEQEKELKINICRSFRAKGRAVEHSCWSLDKTGFNELSSFGFLVLGNNIDEKTFIAAKNRRAAEERQAALASSDRTAGELRGLAQTLIASNWQEARDFEKDPVFQTVFLGEKVRTPDPANLQYRQAVNEFAHRGFILSALKSLENIEFEITELRSGDGNAIPAGQLKIYRIGYLEPAKEVWPAMYGLWSKRPLPELVELVDAPLRLGEFESAQFRLVIDSRKAAPGHYKGTLKIKSTPVEIPVNCEVMDFALPPCEEQPVWIYIFSFMPWGGASGEAWARFYREHYVTDVSMDFPRYTVNGERPKLPGYKKYDTSYIDAVTAYEPPPGAEIRFDGSALALDNRLEICGRYGLRPLFSTRSGEVPPALFPAFLEYLQKHGLAPNQFIYKLGDEDNSPWQLPLAEKILSYAPQTQLLMIPSGIDYWDLKVLEKGFNHLVFSRGVISQDKNTEADLRLLQQNGVKLARYTNRTSWTERTPLLSGRADLWEVMIQDKMDGYQIWTSGINPAAKYRLPYSGATPRPIAEWPPENQSNCQLVYVRKNGDFYKPVSCIRLEDMRDGITDVLYYREAERRLRQAGDTAALQELKALETAPKRNRADYEKIRKQMAELILKYKTGD